MPSLEHGVSEHHERRRVSLDALLKFAAALMTFIPFLFGWTGNHPLGTKVVAGAGIVVFLWIAGPYAIEAIRWLRQRSRDCGFMAREDQRLRESLERFSRFASTNDGRAIVTIVSSITATDYQLAGRMPTIDYVRTWLTCFREQLNTPVKSLVGFLRRCQEFGLIVDQFNRNYVQSIQKLLANETIQAHYIDQLDEFRDEFNDFLRDLESWSGGIGAYIRPREFWRLTPTSFFERVKTFQRAKPVTS